MRVISITSGKGGVGKTNITANLGIALAERGKKVLLWDADLGLANVDVVLGLSSRYNISHVLSGERTLGEILVEGPAGLKIMPASSGIQEMASLNEEQKINLLDELDAYDEPLDFLLIDTAAGIGPNVMYFNVAAQERIVVATVEPTSIVDAYALIKVLCEKYGLKRFNILVNAAPDAREAGAVFRLLTEVADKHLPVVPALDYLGFIPRDEAVPQAIRKQKALLELYPASEAGRAIAALAGRLIHRPPESQTDGNIAFFWRRLLDR
jgi:flagellar biosynthesis protein FlhG